MAPPFMAPRNPEYKVFAPGDLSAFFFLFFDNMSSLVAILGVMASTIPAIATGLGDPYLEIVPDQTLFPNVTVTSYMTAYQDRIWKRSCPGIAVALCFGNLWYAWMAMKLAGHEKRTDVTALPYGINTPAGFISAWNVMLPIAGSLLNTNKNSDGQVTISAADWADKCWQSACAVTFLGGIFEICGSLYDIRPHFSKAALYSPVVAVGFVWLALVPVAEYWAKEPIIGIFPMLMVFTFFFARTYKFKAAVAGGGFFIALVGMILKWSKAGKYLGDHDYLKEQVEKAAEDYAGENQMFNAFPLGYWDDVDKFVAVVFPVALQSFVETMENVEAATANGDEYNLREAMIVDGAGTCLGAFCGAVLPTTVYIGHKMHKDAGAHAGYSILNAICYFFIFMIGLFPLVESIVDPISINLILMAVGLAICQQAVEISAPRHFPALAIGIMCLVCDWGTLNANATHVGIHNMAAGGGIMVSLILPQIICDLIDNRYMRATVFCCIGAFCSIFGIMHGMNPVSMGDTEPSAWPMGGDGDMVVKGQLTVAKWDNKPGWTKLDPRSIANFGPPNLCAQPPEFRVDQETAQGTPSDGMNEGWRFAVAYTMAAAFCLVHVGLQKMGLTKEAVMDNGINPHWAGYTGGAEEPKKEVEVSATSA